LKGPALYKPSACSECRFPGLLIRLFSDVNVRSWNVRQKHVAFRRIAVLLKHKVNSFCELSTTRFVNITRINPEVLQAVMPRLFSAESDLVKPLLSRPIPLLYVLEGNLLRSLYV
jgi:hypothetical protein